MGESDSTTGRSPILEGKRAPVGALLRIGRKGDTGAPIERDRFYIAARREQKVGGRRKTYKPLLPEFAEFNERSAREPVTFFHGELVRAETPQFWFVNRRAQFLPNHPGHPNRRPVCSSSDGVTAKRLIGIGDDGEEEWKEMECPGYPACEFTKEWDSKHGKIRPCKVAVELYFIPRWVNGENLPAPLMAWASHSINSAENCQGMLNFIRDTVEESGIPWRGYMGIPFTMSLGESTNRGKGYRYPEVHFAVDGDLTNILLAQRANLKMLEAAATPLSLPEAPGEEEVRDTDFEEISVEPGVPGNLPFNE